MPMCLLAEQHTTTSQPRATRAKRNQEVTVEDVLPNAQIDTSDPDLLEHYKQVFTVESKKSAF